jgi:hypothetical protein
VPVFGGNALPFPLRLLPLHLRDPCIMEWLHHRPGGVNLSTEFSDEALELWRCILRRSRWVAWPASASLMSFMAVSCIVSACSALARMSGVGTGFPAFLAAPIQAVIASCTSGTASSSGYRVLDANGIVLAHVYGQPCSAVGSSHRFDRPGFGKAARGAWPSVAELSAGGESKNSALHHRFARGRKETGLRQRDDGGSESARWPRLLMRMAADEDGATQPIRIGSVQCVDAQSFNPAAPDRRRRFPSNFPPQTPMLLIGGDVMKWFFIIIYLTAGTAPPDKEDLVGSTVMESISIEGAYYRFDKSFRVRAPAEYIAASREECEEIRTDHNLRQGQVKGELLAMTPCLKMSDHPKNNLSAP